MASNKVRLEGAVVVVPKDESLSASDVRTQVNDYLAEYNIGELASIIDSKPDIPSVTNAMIELFGAAHAELVAQMISEAYGATK